MRFFALIAQCLALVACSSAPDAGVDSGFDTGSDVPSADVATDVVADRNEVEAWLEANGTVDVEAMVAWARAGAYRSWTTGTRHPSDAPPGGSQVYIGPTLADSLAASAQTHPTGAVAVREIFGADLTTLRITNVLIKLDGANGTEWLFYEITDPADTPNLTVSEPFAPGCLACHNEQTDYVMSPWPLP